MKVLSPAVVTVRAEHKRWTDSGKPDLFNQSRFQLEGLLDLSTGRFGRAGHRIRL